MQEEKVVLSSIKKEDEGRFWELSQKKEILRFLPDWQMTAGYSARLAEASRSGGFLSPAEQQLLWGIYVDGVLQGAFSMGPEWRIGYKIALGFWLNPAVWGRGILQKALKEGENRALSAEIENLYALTACENQSALKALFRADYRVEEEISLRPEGKKEKIPWYVLKKEITKIKPPKEE